MTQRLLPLAILLIDLALLAETAIPLAGIANCDFETKDAKGNLASWTQTAVACEENPHGGKYCASQASNGSTWDVIMHHPFIKAKPETRYRVTVWNRNTLNDGRAKFGVRCIDSQNDTMRVRDKVGYFWRNIIPGRNEWTEYTLEFITPPELHALNFYFQIAKKDGECYWDDISIVELQP